MVDDIAGWLAGLGLGRYAATFAANHVDWAALRDLSDAELEHLGVTLGHRKKLRRAIAACQIPSKSHQREVYRSPSAGK